MFFTFLKLAVFAYYLLWGSRAQEIEIGGMAGPVPEEMAEPLAAKPLVLKMAADGTMEFEGQAVAKKDLGKLLKDRVQLAPASGLKIEIAPGITEESVFDIVDIAENAGIETIGTDPHIDIPPAATLEVGE